MSDMGGDAAWEARCNLHDSWAKERAAKDVRIKELEAGKDKAETRLCEVLAERDTARETLQILMHVVTEAVGEAAFITAEEAVLALSDLFDKHAAEVSTARRAGWEQGREEAKGPVAKIANADRSAIEGMIGQVIGVAATKSTCKELVKKIDALTYTEPKEEDR